MKLKPFCTHLFLFALCFSSAFAQSAKKIESYTVGEQLVYEAKFSKAVFRGIAVADLTFSVENAPNGSDFLIKAEAISAELRLYMKSARGLSAKKFHLCP